jgi:hypothetical protein
LLSCLDEDFLTAPDAHQIDARLRVHEADVLVIFSILSTANDKMCRLFGSILGIFLFFPQAT